MIKTINSKAQHTLKGLTILSASFIALGLCGSYETDRINGIQLLTQLVTMACITFTAYIALSYVNIMIANKLKEIYKDDKRCIKVSKGYRMGRLSHSKYNNKNINEIA